MQKKKIISVSSNLLFKTATEEYRNFLKEYTKDEILVFVLQRPQRILWKETLKDEFHTNISSYFSFIQKEIRLNWDLVLENSKILKKNIKKPVFLTFESSQTLMIKVIEYLKTKGQLKEIAFTDEELAQKMLSNLYSLSSNNIPYTRFSNLIRKQELHKELLSEKSYEELNKLLEIYITRTLKEGVIDYPSSLYIYNNLLLKNIIYLKSLKKYKKIIVNDFDCQIPAICNFLIFFENITVYENSNGPYGIYFPNGKKSETFINEFNEKNLDLQKSDTFLEKLSKNLFFNENFNLQSKELHINNEFESKSDIIEFLIKIINNYWQDKIISIISPCRNILLEYRLSEICKINSIPFITLDKNERILENPCTYALSSLAIIYYNFGNIYLNSDELKQILILIFDFNYFEATKLSNTIKGDKYFLEKILKNSKNFELNTIKKLQFFIDFFSKTYKNVYDFYSELLTYKELFSKDIYISIKKLTDISKNFIENIKVFENFKDYNLEFFTSVRKGLKETESLDEIQHKLSFSGVSLGTPTSFLNYAKKSDFTILIDIENNLWNIKFVNIIQNPFLLGNYFYKDFFYDSEIDNQLKREELFNMISRLKHLTKETLIFLGINSIEGSLLKESIDK
ncbi:MAG: hypothetical protein JXM74_05075 [Fusobacteriaceae bacterium]|nr:hypothetical protein [Fusobacteriaceae bacterium]